MPASRANFVPERRAAATYRARRIVGRGINRHGGRNRFQRDAGKEPFHVLDGIDRHSGLAHLARRPGGVGVVADLGGEVEGHGKAVAALGQEKFVTLIGLLRIPHPGILAHGPQAAPVHGGPDAPGEGVLPGVAQVAIGVEAGQILAR